METNRAGFHHTPYLAPSFWWIQFSKRWVPALASVQYSWGRVHIVVAQSAANGGPSAGTRASGACMEGRIPEQAVKKTMYLTCSLLEKQDMMHMCQLQVDYSVVYFAHDTAIKTLQHRASIKGWAHTCCKETSGIYKPHPNQSSVLQCNNASKHTTE